MVGFISGRPMELMLVENWKGLGFEKRVDGKEVGRYLVRVWLVGQS